MSSELMIPTLLAAGWEDFIVVIFLFISFLGWIVNALKKAAEKNEPRNQPRDAQIGRGGDRKKPLQGEIDDFLKDVLGVDKVKQAQEKQHEAKQRRRRQQQPQPERPPQQPKKRQSVKARAKKKPAQPLFDEAAPSSLSRHVTEKMSSQLGHISSSVHNRVEKDMGHDSFSDYEARLNSKGPSVGEDLLKMLRTKEGAQQAILLNEIFSKPKCQR